MKSYSIIDVVINHPTAGNINKKNIIYYTDGVEDLRENYQDGDVIRPEYIQTKPDDTVLGLVTKMSPEAIAQLKELLK